MPFNPEFLPEMALLLAGVIALGVALSFALRRRPRPALGSAVVAVALIGLAFFLGRSPETHSINRTLPSRPPAVDAIVPMAPTPAPPGAGSDADTVSSTSLMLGGVELKVTPSDHYTLAVDGRRFLILDTRNAAGLLATCEVGNAEGQIAVRLMRNRPILSRVALQRPDNNTLLMRDSGVDLMRIHFADPRRIEVLGSFFPLGRGTPVVITPTGIHWPGGGATAGTMVDLRHFGKGTVDFTGTGKIRIRATNQRRV